MVQRLDDLFGSRDPKRRAAQVDTVGPSADALKGVPSVRKVKEHEDHKFLSPKSSTRRAGGSKCWLPPSKPKEDKL